MKQYVTIQADTFDQIALDQYGDDLATREIMAENGTRNPELLTVWRFDYGQSLAIPDRKPSQAVVSTLPEYRRPQ
jgi:hypothetical protein